jgi:rhodanese-related sulfurtransferase
MDDDAAIPAIDARTADARLHGGEAPAPILLDVREPHEFTAGRAVGATHVPSPSGHGRGAGGSGAMPRSGRSALHAR